MNDLRMYIINEVIDRLGDYEGCQMYGSEIAQTLFEGNLIDGTMTYSTYEAQKWVGEYFDDIGEIVEELKFNFGSMDYIPNVFENPEMFMVVIVNEGASYLLGQTSVAQKNWNNEFKLTRAKINKIRTELEALNNTYGFYE